MKRTLLTSLLLALCFVASGKDRSESTLALIRALSGEEMNGRLTGTPGEQAAAELLVDQFTRTGLKPLGDAGFLHPFEFTAGTRDAGSTLEWAGETHGQPAVRGLSFSAGGQVTGPVVFAGYGISVPDGQDFGYDSYAGLEVTDKIVLVLRYFPEDADPDTRRILARYSGLRYKALTAREHGAAGLLVVTGPNSPNAGELAPMSFDTSISGSGIVAATLTGDLGERLLQAGGSSLAEAQTALDSGNPHVSGFDLGEDTMTLKVELERESRTGHNLLGVLRSEHPVDDKPWLVIGAHYDHLGRGEGGNSLAKGDEAGQIHHGADDNASGVAAVLDVARRLAAEPLDRHLLVALWSGEELGVIGSSRFIADAVLPLEQIAAYVNFDMVGRSQDNRLTVQGIGSSEAWPGLVERGNVVVGFDLNLNQDPYLPTDSTSFYTAGVPTLNFFTGTHEDYHRPTDTADRINVEDLLRVGHLGSLVVRRLAALETAPAYAVVERSSGDGAGRSSLRAYTGTIPDYTTEVEGLRLSGVTAGGPAAEAGVKAGDIIVEFGGQTVTNIYDYTYALDAVKIGEPIDVVVMRGDERLTLTIVPTARD